MSSIAGCWNYNNNDTNNKHCFEQMFEALRKHPHEKHSNQTYHHITFGQTLKYNTPESLYENLPVYLQSEKIFFTAQGQVDNRSQLIDKLGLKDTIQVADGTIMLQAWLRWGKNCVNYIRGDWSFAVFDYKTQELFIARDPIGYTSIFYYQDATGFYFSSSIKSILALPNYSKRVNEKHLLRVLAIWDITNAKQDTYFEKIFSIPNAHFLLVKNKEIVTKNYWQPQNIPLRYYKRKEDYIDEMIELFTTAVNSKLRSDKPIASMLSGGLDSSTVSYIAASLLNYKNKQLTTFSHTPFFTDQIANDQEGKNRLLDESPLIKEVVRTSGNIKPLFLKSENYSVLKGITDFIEIFDSPTHASCNTYWLLDIFNSTAKNGFGTLLSGEGGNSSISFSGIDYLLPLKISRLVRHPIWFLKKQIAKPLYLKYASKTPFTKAANVGNREGYLLNMHIRQNIVEKNNLLQNGRNFSRYISDIQKDKLDSINVYQYRSTIGAAAGSYFGFELKDPTVDVDLLEYFFAIPNDVFFDEHYNNRMLVKGMMKNKMPDTVLFAKKRGLQSSDIAYRVKNQAHEIDNAMNDINYSIAANYFIDTKKLTQTWKTFLNTPYMPPGDVQNILKSLQFSMFLQKYFD